MKIAVCYLAYDRPNFFDLFVSNVSRIKKKNKSKLEIHIMNNDMFLDKKIIKQKMKDTGIKFVVHEWLDLGTPFDYDVKMKKIPSIKADYYIKHDEDTFFNNHVWDYMIENAGVLDDEKNVCMSPLINNGIPSVEMFIDCFLTSEEKAHVYGIFSSFKIPNMWGADYQGLWLGGPWNGVEFFNRVSNINHHYKGIHPVRLCVEAHNYILDCVYKRIDEFYVKKDYSLISKNYPYLCNQVILIKADVYRKILEDKTLWVDAFDEVAICKYSDRHNLNYLFIDNSMCINTGYRQLTGYEVFQDSHYNKLQEASNKKKTVKKKDNNENN